MIYDDNEKPACVKDFQKVINQNICGECGLKFLTGKLLKKHNIKHHLKENDRDDKVGKQNESKRKESEKKEVDESKGHGNKGMDLKCIKCSESFVTKQDLQMHMINEHQKDTKYKKCKYKIKEKITSWKCTECKKTFKAHSNLVSHLSMYQVYIKIEHGEPSTSRPHGTHCITCNQDFHTKAELKKHYDEEHESKKVKCDKCPKSFSSKYSLDQHVTVEHQGK